MHRDVPQAPQVPGDFVMRNTKLILAMLAGCMTVSGAALAQSATQTPSPTPASTAATPTQTTHDSMKKTGDSMSQDSMSHDSMKSGASDSMKSTHKKHKKSSTGTTEPAKSSTSGM
jgi:hypothetical protein